MTDETEHPSVARVRQALREAGAATGSVDGLRILPDAVTTARAAAEALGVETGQIANSLVFDADSEPLLVLTAGDHRVDTEKVAALLGIGEPGGAPSVRARLAAARDALGGCLRAYLVGLAEKQPDRLERFLGLHHRAIRALAVEDDEFYRLIIDWLPFETSLGTMAFGEYRTAHDRIRYVADVDSFRQVARVAAAQNLAVINAGHTFDVELLKVNG